MDNLTRDTIEARKAGMSYGRWKAEQGIREVAQRDSVDPDKVRYCKNCGASFAKGKHHRVFCSDSCCKSYRYRRNRLNMQENRYRCKED